MTTKVTAPKSALQLLNVAIAELEARLNIKSEETTEVTTTTTSKSTIKKDKTNKKVEESATTPTTTTDDIPDVCKLEFKVGVITKVWVHESADKLYCEEIDVGEDQPRQIASGLRHHFTLEQMLGQRLIVISNLKPKNLVGFKSHGMVLCAAKMMDGMTNEIVEFVEPPPDAMIGEVITFEGLSCLPNPVTPNVVEKKKLFANVAAGMMANEQGIAQWNGHTFMTTAGPCRTRTVTNCPLR
jgi:aminoacyl tRNA synthase complex-interacting multifunctional protein 1